MLLPNNRQKTKLFQYAGTARFAYNWALSRKHSPPSFYQDNVKIQFTDTHVKAGGGFSVSKKKNKQKLNWIRLAEHHRIPAGNVKYYNPRIKFDGSNWYITVGTESYAQYNGTINRRIQETWMP